MTCGADVDAAWFEQFAEQNVEAFDGLHEAAAVFRKSVTTGRYQSPRDTPEIAAIPHGQ